MIERVLSLIQTLARRSSNQQNGVFTHLGHRGILKESALKHEKLGALVGTGYLVPTRDACQEPTHTIDRGS
jgi:hypothetical protein